MAPPAPPSQGGCFRALLLSLAWAHRGPKAAARHFLGVVLAVQAGIGIGIPVTPLCFMKVIGRGFQPGLMDEGASMVSHSSPPVAALQDLNGHHRHSSVSRPFGHPC